eukprot:14653672-Alexandrium_andersonii.AAC.1
MAARPAILAALRMGPCGASRASGRASIPPGPATIIHSSIPGSRCPGVSAGSGSNMASAARCCSACCSGASSPACRAPEVVQDRLRCRAQSRRSRRTVQRVLQVLRGSDHVARARVVMSWRHLVARDA